MMMKRMLKMKGFCNVFIFFVVIRSGFLKYLKWVVSIVRIFQRDRCSLAG